MGRGGRAARIVAAVLGLGIALGLGAWRAGMSAAESVHFSVNIPSSDSGGVPGGLGPRGREGRIVVDIAKQGWPKRLLQPTLVDLSSHWVRNVSARPLRVAFDLEASQPVPPVVPGVPAGPAMDPAQARASDALTVLWESNQKAFDTERHVLDRDLAPGEAVTVDWLFRLPGSAVTDLPDERGPVVIFSGAIVARDQVTGKELTRLPLLIGKRLTTSVIQSECHGP